MLDDLNLISEIQKSLELGESIDHFVHKVEELVNRSPLSLMSIFAEGTVLYRTTNHHQSIAQNISELWFPPKNYAALNRANREGNPMFYASSDPLCTCLEIGIQPEQLAIHSKWAVEKQMMLHDIGYTRKAFERANSKRTVPGDNWIFEKTNFTKVHDFIHLAFTNPGSKNYPLTAAIAEVFLRSHEICGIRYPAISKNAAVDNVALNPEFVVKNLKLITATLVKVISIKEKKLIKGEAIADLKNISSNGKLNWEFRTPGVKVAPGNSLAVGVGKFTFQKDGKIKIEGKTYEIKAGYSIDVPQWGDPIIRNLRGQMIKPIKN